MSSNDCDNKIAWVSRPKRRGLDGELIRLVCGDTIPAKVIKLPPNTNFVICNTTQEGPVNVTLHKKFSRDNRPQKGKIIRITKIGTGVFFYGPISEESNMGGEVGKVEET